MTAVQTNVDSEFEKKFSEISKELLQTLEAKDVGGTIQLITQLQKMRDESLYQEVGRLTRTLHESIKNFHIDRDMSDEDDENAKNRLAYVVNLTARAANKTMDKVEESMPLSEDISTGAEELNTQWNCFLDKQMQPDEFRDMTKRITAFLNIAESNSKKMNENLSDILLAQDYQDLTGQVIQKVATMVTDVEAQLVNLVLMAGHVDRITGIEHGDIEAVAETDPVKGEGPQINTEKEGVVSNQDDVDDLLSSLGF